MKRTIDHTMMPRVPEDAYAARGHYGQSTFIIPSRQLVVIRMGQSFRAARYRQDFHAKSRQHTQCELSLDLCIYVAHLNESICTQ